MTTSIESTGTAHGAVRNVKDRSEEIATASVEQKTAAGAFVAFLRTKQAQEVLPEFGFRPVDASVDVSAHLNGDVGIDPAQPAVSLPQPAPECSPRPRG